MTRHQATSQPEPGQTSGTVAVRLAVLVLVPVASLLVAVSVVVFGTWTDISQADALERSAQVAKNVGDLVDHTQAEWGLSVHHLANDLGPLSQDLVTARDELDKALDVVRADAESGDVDPQLRQALAAQVTASAAEAAGQAQAAANSSAEVSASIHTVASASAQLSASIDDVARAAGEAATIAADGALLARDASSIVVNLGESSNRIGGVMALISSIAKQTNLLALNATIEAARAGSAGKGFAVVASEVKDLSHQVTQATEEISGQVAGIQADADAASTAIAQVAEVITRVNETQETIASVVREQMKATSEIDHNVHRTAMRADEITATIEALASGAEEFSRCAVDTRGAAGDLNRAARELSSLVGIT